MSRQKEQSKEISTRKVTANRKNAQRSTGPHNSTLTRYNAAKHGLLAEGVTEMDTPEEFNALLTQLRKELQPVGVLEHECVQQVAIFTIRIRRAKLLEAEAFRQELNPAKTIKHPGTLSFDEETFGRTEVVDPGLPARISNDAIDQINRTILRYETANENKLFRWQNYLERLQRLRTGEKLPAPATADLTIHHEGGTLASFGNSLQE
jgi:hypothetical protein